MDELKNNSAEESVKNRWQTIAIAFIMLFGISVLANFLGVSMEPKKNQLVDNTQQEKTQVEGEEDYDRLLSIVLPQEGVELPIIWGDLGKQLVDTGVIDKVKLGSLYGQRGGLDEETARLLEQIDSGKIVMTSSNSGTLLNLFWAFGLANKNAVLDNGPMQDAQYGGAGNFASTGGWTLAKGDAMEHYSKHGFVQLTGEQQSLVERVSKGIYRPCCGNSTYFPDCNHGMAMLGLLELMAAQGVSEQEMYKVALQVNAFWFPSTYLTIAKYMEKQGTEWPQVDAKLALGESFSSAYGFRRILAEVEPVQSGGGGGCGV